MTCREFIEFLWQYVSGELSAAEQARFDEHMARCAKCVRYLKSYEATITLERAALAATDEPVPADVPEELIRAILDARRK